MSSSIEVPQCKRVDPDHRNKPRRRISIEEAVTFAESKNGKYLSEEVNKNAQKLFRSVLKAISRKQAARM